MKNLAELIESSIADSQAIKRIEKDIEMLRQHIAYVKCQATKTREEICQNEKLR